MKYLNEGNFGYSTHGLSFTNNDLKVLDEVLEAFNKQTRYIEAIIEGNIIAGFKHKVHLQTNQFIIELDKYLTAEKKSLTTAAIINNTKEKSLPPALHLNLESPSLKAPY